MGIIDWIKSLGKKKHSATRVATGSYTMSLDNTPRPKPIPVDGIAKVFKDRKGKWRFNILAKNYKVIATSEEYNTRRNALNTIQVLVDMKAIKVNPKSKPWS